MKKLIINACVLSALLLASCSDEESTNVVPKEETAFINEEVAKTYRGTQSPGDVWTWQLDKEQGHMTASWDYGTFDDTSDDISIEGTFVTLPSGYLKVTITAAEPASAEIPTDGSAWFYALEVPDMAMVIKPEGSIKGDIIAMVAEGDCNAVEGTYNYIITAPGNGKDFDPVVQEAFGYAELTDTGDSYEISAYKWSLDCISGPCSDTGEVNGVPLAICTEGGALEISDGGSTVAQGQFTQAGAMMMDFGYGNGGFFALKASELAQKEAMANNTYIGLAYLPENNDEKTVPVQLDFSLDSDLDRVVGYGRPFTDIENNILDDQEGAGLIVENVVNGRAYGSMVFGELTTDMAAALHVNGNDQILIVTSTSPEEGNPPIILILAKKN